MVEQKAWLKFLVVFLYHGVGSVLPLALTYIEKNPTWLLMIPIIKAGWETLESYLKEKQYIGSESKWH